MHVTSGVSAVFKNVMLDQLNYNGTPVRISEQILDLLEIFSDYDAKPRVSAANNSPGPADALPLGSFPGTSDQQ